MSDHAVVRAVLEELKGRVEKASQEFPPLHHMLVLPPGECLLLPENSSDQLLGIRGSWAVGYAVDDMHNYTGPLPPKSAWPDGQQVETISAEYEYAYPPTQEEKKPDCLHFLLGAAGKDVVLQSDSWHSLMRSEDLHLWRRTREGLHEFSQIAAELMEERRGIDSAIFQNQRSPRFSVFHDNSGVHIRGAREVDHAGAIDAWLCTIHWWAWKCPESPLWTRPRVVRGEKAIEASPLEHAVRERLSFSVLPCDVFSATANMVNLLLEFLAVQPDLAWDAPYPPEAAEQNPSGDGPEWSKVVSQKDLRTKLVMSQETLKDRLVDGEQPVTGKYRCRRPKPTARKIQVAVEDMPEHLHGWLRKQVISG